MRSHTIHGLAGTDGLMTFHFFCESITHSINTLDHVLKHYGLTMPEESLELSEALTSMGVNLMVDYSKDRLRLDRIRRELLTFCDLAFTINDDIGPHIPADNVELIYYYYVFVEGINLFAPNLLQSLRRDGKGHEDMQKFIDKIAEDFSLFPPPDAQA